MSLLVEQLEANGLSLRHVVDARVFLAGEDPKRDDRGFERAWKRGFEPIGPSQIRRLPVVSRWRAETLHRGWVGGLYR